MEELSWGILLVAYLFVGGMAGGSYIVAAFADLLGKGRYRVLSKSGVYVSLLCIVAGLALLIIDLGRFEVDPLTPLNAYVNFPTSIMSVGTWIVTAFTVVSLLTAILWFFQGSDIIRKILEAAGIVLGGSTAAYTGLLLAFSRGRPFWSTPYLPWLFIVSGALTGLAVSLFVIPVVAKLMPRFFEDFRELFENKTQYTALIGAGQKYIMALIVIELGLVAIELGFGNAYGEFALAGLSFFFLGYMFIGLIVPLLIGYYSISPSPKREGSIIFLSLCSFLLILAGGFLLRYIILYTGQIVA